MGTLIEKCHIKYCSSENEEGDEESYDDKEENNKLEEIQYSRYVTFAPKTKIEFPVKLKNLFKQRNTNPWKYYKELQTIGKGSFGIVKKVCLINHEETIRAMKIIPKSNINKDETGRQLVDEIDILKNLEHPNIIKIYECFEDNENVYIISEYCDGGDLLGKMEKVHSMNEIVVKFLMGQILNAIAYLHSNKVFHGDIKLENVMLNKATNKGSTLSRINKDLQKNQKLQNDINTSFNRKTFKKLQSFNYIMDMYDYEVKLIDFGCCKYYDRDKTPLVNGIIGTCIYCSPEVIDDLYDDKSDEWSCGVLMYILLCGKPPFIGDTEEEIFTQIKKGKFYFDKPEFKNVSENCKKLIKKLLQPNSKKRIKASKALHEPFFNENYNPSVITQDVKKEDIERLLTVEKLPSKFHELIEAYLCYNFVRGEEEKNLRKLFRYFDFNEENRLLKDDFERAFKDNDIEYTEEDLDNIMEALDSDGNNSIEYQEFLRGMCDKEALHSDKNLKKVFEAIDEDSKGYINVQDIKNFIFKNKEIEDKKFQDYLKSIGMNLNSKLKYDEFVDIIREKKLATIIIPKTKNKNEEEQEKNKEDINQIEETKNSE